MNKEDFTILFTGHNIRNHIEVVIKSFRLRVPEYKDRIVVFDDDSNDGTLDLLLRENVRRISWSESFDKYRSHHNPNTSLKVSAIFNDAITQINTKYLITIDGDIFFKPNFGTFFYKVLNFFYNNSVDVLGLSDYCTSYNSDLIDSLNIKKYDILLKHDRYERISHLFMIANIQKLKLYGIIYDQLDNDIYNEAMTLVFDTGVDFTYQVFKNINIKVNTISSPEALKYFYHFAGASSRALDSETNYREAEYINNNRDTIEHNLICQQISDELNINME